MVTDEQLESVRQRLISHMVRKKTEKTSFIASMNCGKHFNNLSTILLWNYIQRHHPSIMSEEQVFYIAEIPHTASFFLCLSQRTMEKLTGQYLHIFITTWRVMSCVGKSVNAHAKAKKFFFRIDSWQLCLEYYLLLIIYQFFKILRINSSHRP